MSEDADGLREIEALRDENRALRAEVERLRGDAEDGGALEEVRRSLMMASVIASVDAPRSGDLLLQTIVEAAAQIIPSPAAALLLVDESAGDMVFEVATGGPAADEVRKMRVPIGHGIAGMVAATGQAMIINDSLSDTRQADDIASRVGYKPARLLCVPLVWRGRLAGVLELLDKEGGYDNADLHALSLFSEVCALAVEQSIVRRGAARVVAGALAQLVPDGAAADNLRVAVQGLFERASATPEFGRAAEMAEMVNRIAGHSENASEACLALLRGFGDYLGKTSPRRG